MDTKEEKNISYHKKYNRVYLYTSPEEKKALQIHAVKNDQGDQEHLSQIIKGCCGEVE